MDCPGDHGRQPDHSLTTSSAPFVLDEHLVHGHADHDDNDDDVAAAAIDETTGGGGGGGGSGSHVVPDRFRPYAVSPPPLPQPRHSMEIGQTEAAFLLDRPQQQSTGIGPLSSPRRKERSTRKLQKRHGKMVELHEHVSWQREKLRLEYEDLSYRLEVVRVSQEDIMNALKEELKQLNPTRNLDYLFNLWDGTQRDATTFQARLERVVQLSEALVDSEAHLIIADENFVAGANSFMQSIEAPPSPRTARPMALQTMLDRSRADLAMFNERLDELMREQDEDTLTRDLLLDRGDTPAVPDQEFQDSYHSARAEIEKDLERVHSDMARLEAERRAQGLGPSTFPTSIIHDDPEDDDNGSNTYASSIDGLAELPSRTSQPPSEDAWSLRSTDGSHQRRSSIQINRIKRWVDTVKTVETVEPDIEIREDAPTVLSNDNDPQQPSSSDALGRRDVIDQPEHVFFAVSGVQAV